MDGSSRLPAGIVTFVFSDIEGSTRLIRRLGDRYPGILDRHRALLRSAWTMHGGEEVGTEGDSFFVAFTDTGAALRACAEGQRLLAAEPWPPDGVVRVRMGVHSGLAAPHNGDYLALAVNQAARVINAAHGGQVIVSQDAAGRASLADGLGLVDVGCFRLRDFDDTVRLFQLTGPGLDPHFPGVRALPADGHNLVRPANAFIGRDNDVARVASLLKPGAVVTIVGPGGVGKTRLATEVGIQVASDWTDGLWAVDLAAIEDPSLAADAVAAAVGAPASGANRWIDVLEHLRPRSALLLLDNAEQYVEQCARMVPELLRRCHRVGVLVTSRERLRVDGEEIVRLAPLPVPDAAATAAQAEKSAAVSLFLDRAHAARPGLALEPATVAPIVGICRRLDGLPLAIEIAAARCAVLDPAAILAGLDDMYRLLRTSDRSLPERQRTLRALLDWSYRLLSADEQAAFRRLSAFGDGFSLEGARAAVADDGLAGDEVAELVWSLVDQSLLAADLAANGTRYRFLETVRQYGRRALDEASETDAVAGRLAAWFLDRLGPWHSTDRAWISDASLELENLRALIPLVAPVDAEAAQQLACSIGRFRDSVQSIHPGIEELSRLAAQLPFESPSRVSLLTTLGFLHMRVNDVDAAKRVLTEASELRARVGPAPWDDAGVERTAGEIAMRNGEFEAAAAIAREALGRSLSPRGRARMWNLIGLARSSAGDLPGAIEAFGEERAEHIAVGHEASLAGAEGNLAEISLRLGDFASAARHQHACLQLAIELGQPVMIANSLIVASGLAAAAGEWATATRLHARALAMLEATGWSLYDDDLRASLQLRADARAQLGDANFEQAVAAGTAMEAPAAASLADEVLVATRSAHD
ncbi:MAG: adenylate/guanylate cyclase domain-containing protein [Chloroflexi bacterium]|nr:adenylate/guanylate cyclase domain-containing protein [Chloroflexota bacterium]